MANRPYRLGSRIDVPITAGNRRKSPVRVKFEHSIGIINRTLGFQKVCYRGLARKLHRLEMAAALANLLMACRRLLHA